MNQLQANRCVKLIDHLRSDVCADHWDLKAWATDDNFVGVVRRGEMGCGSAGCLIGHCAALWPGQIKMVEGIYPQIRRDNSRSRDQWLCEWLGIEPVAFCSRAGVFYVDRLHYFISGGNGESPGEVADYLEQRMNEAGWWATDA